MRLFKKEAWDNIIYNLWYPGFLGSMIYDLLPEKFNYEYITGLPSSMFLVKSVIVLFFVVDYFHLYNDVHKMVTVKRRGVDYFLCDALTSIFFLISFFTVNTPFLNGWPRFLTCALFLVLATACVGVYKLRNIDDNWFFKRYVSLSVIIYSLYIALERFLSKYFDVQIIFLTLVFIHFCFYCYYVYGYYNKNSLLYYVKERIKDFNIEDQIKKAVQKEINKTEASSYKGHPYHPGKGEIKTLYHKAQLKENTDVVKYDDILYLSSEVLYTVAMGKEDILVKDIVETRWMLEDMELL